MRFLFALFSPATFYVQKRTCLLEAGLKRYKFRYFSLHNFISQIYKFAVYLSERRLNYKRGEKGTWYNM